MSVSGKVLVYFCFPSGRESGFRDSQKQPPDEFVVAWGSTNSNAVAPRYLTSKLWRLTLDPRPRKHSALTLCGLPACVCAAKLRKTKKKTMSLTNLFFNFCAQAWSKTTICKVRSHLPRKVLATFILDSFTVAHFIPGSCWGRFCLHVANTHF